MTDRQLQRSHVLKMLFASIADWDRGIDLETAEIESENIRKNMAAESAEHKSAMDYRKFMVQGMTKEETALFDMLRKRRVNMRQPENLIEEKFDDKALLELAKKIAAMKNGTFAKIALYSGGYGLNLQSRNFEARKNMLQAKPAKALSRPADEIVMLLEKERERQKQLKDMQRRRAQNRTNAGRNK